MTKPTTNGTAVGYFRVSTDEQAASGLGLEAQRAAVTSAAARLGLVVVAEFTDAGVSGAVASDKRPGLAAAMGATKRGSVLLVAKRDRLSRDVAAMVTIERYLNRRGARVVSAAGEGTDDDEAGSVFMRRIVDAIGEHECGVTRARTRAAMGAKRARGEFTGGVSAPFGFDLAADGRTLALNVAEQAVIMRIGAYGAEGKSLREIAAVLNAEGFRTKRGAEWKAVQVARVLEKASLSKARL